MDSQRKIAEFVYRINYDGDAEYWGCCRQIQASQSVTVVGVLTRPIYKRVPGAESLDELEERIEDSDATVEWLPEEMDT
jgi:hypothetical protein